MHVTAGQLEIHLSVTGIGFYNGRHVFEGFNKIPGIQSSDTAALILLTVGIKGKQACEVSMPALMGVNFPEPYYISFILVRNRR